MTKILIVDDQACIRELLSEELISEGYRVATAGDAESVSGHLRFSQPDLVLLDLYLDGPDGIGVFEDIKRQDPDLPVIIFTAYDSYLDDPRLSQANVYVIKRVLFLMNSKERSLMFLGANRRLKSSRWRRISPNFVRPMANGLRAPPTMAKIVPNQRDRDVRQ